ncbi:MAG: hydroxyacylglutathione hydrolase [Bauldia sp.]|nr:hydroxyacylglutathione hydrolase [Bauldia sp.]
MPFIIDQTICRTDNVAVLVHDPASGETIAIDAPDAEAIAARLRERGWRLTAILNTHRHHDHVAGNAALKAATGCTIVGPAGEAEAIPAIDGAVGEGDTIAFGGTTIDVLETPGHTMGHIVYRIPSENLAFVGDVMFSLGCGRIVEGAAEAMWGSLAKLAALPRETIVYCGHDNTADNGRFAVTVEPHNIDLAARVAEVAALRRKGLPTTPTTIGQEQATNPFLRAGKRRLRRAIGMEDAEPAAVFAELRRRKDAFA